MSQALSQTACNIRFAKKREIRKIEESSVRAYSEYRDGLPATIGKLYTEDLLNLSHYWDGTIVLVADVGGRIAGSVRFYPDASTEGLGLPRQWAGFRKLAVDPAFRGRSIGRMLVARCLELASMKGAPAVGIHTVSFMAAARHIYEDMGFRRCPQFDLRISDILGSEASSADIAVIAYRLDISPYV